MTLAELLFRLESRISSCWISSETGSSGSLSSGIGKGCSFWKVAKLLMELDPLFMLEDIWGLADAWDWYFKSSSHIGVMPVRTYCPLR